MLEQLTRPEPSTSAGEHTDIREPEARVHTTERTPRSWFAEIGRWRADAMR